VSGCFEHGNTSSNSINGGTFHGCLLLKRTVLLGISLVVGTISRLFLENLSGMPFSV
jgi:hypothetical protein